MKIDIYEDSRKLLGYDEIKYLLLLEFHERFEASVIQLRSKLGIDINEPDNPRPEFQIPIQKMMEELNIPPQIYYQVSDLVTCGFVYTASASLTVLGSGITSGENKMQIWMPNSTLLGFPKICLNRKPKWTRFIKDLKENWKRIEMSWSAFENSFPYPSVIKKISPRGLNVYMDICRLKHEGFTHSEIADKLNLLDEQESKDKYSKLNKILRKIQYIK